MVEVGGLEQGGVSNSRDHGKDFVLCALPVGKIVVQ